MGVYTSLQDHVLFFVICFGLSQYHSSCISGLLLQQYFLQLQFQDLTQDPWLLFLLTPETLYLFAASEGSYLLFDEDAANTGQISTLHTQHGLEQQGDRNSC